MYNSYFVTILVCRNPLGCIRHPPRCEAEDCEVILETERVYNHIHVRILKRAIKENAIQKSEPQTSGAKNVSSTGHIVWVVTRKSDEQKAMFICDMNKNQVIPYKIILSIE